MSHPLAELDAIDNLEERERARAAVLFRLGPSKLQRANFYTNVVGLAITATLVAYNSNRSVFGSSLWYGWLCSFSPSIVLVGVGIIAALVKRHRLRREIRRELWRVDKPVCMSCGYRLNPVPERCPECGVRINDDPP